ncbi:MAG: hypothetical protein GY778_04745 [bacterium]|nr:hypothetical protein [bacterium]
MNQQTAHPDGKPVFAKCVRCGYSLRGLPARHACPECGLRYDERCALYKVLNPKAVIALWVCIFGGGWVNLKNLPALTSLDSVSWWRKVLALFAVMWVVILVFGVWWLVRMYRRGFLVAVTADGLIVRIMGFDGQVIPWTNIGRAAVKDRPEGKPQMASIFLKDKNKHVTIGGPANVFPTRADVERFVGQVNERIGAAPAEVVE